MKKMQMPSLDNLHVVPEEIIRQCAKAMSQMGEEENNFSEFLAVAKEFKNAGLTPIFLCSGNMKDLYVTTREKLEKKIN